MLIFVFVVCVVLLFCWMMMMMMMMFFFEFQDLIMIILSKEKTERKQKKRRSLETWITNPLRFEVRFNKFSKEISIHLMPCSHWEPPLVTNLATEIEIDLSHKKAIRVAREARSARAIRQRDIGRAIEAPEQLVCWLPISRRELMLELLCPHSVHAPHKIAVCNRCVPSFDAPHRL